MAVLILEGESALAYGQMRSSTQRALIRLMIRAGKRANFATLRRRSGSINGQVLAVSATSRENKILERLHVLHRHLR